MMRAADVLEILDLLGGAGARVWVDGGWGVDALLREAGRPHSDLDLVVMIDEIEIVQSILDKAGFRTVLRDWLPSAYAVADENGREIDLHPVTRTPDGGGDQRLPDGTDHHHPAPVTGLIGGREVPCADAEAQVRSHLGYPPTDKDRLDLARLAERFGLVLPPPYA